MADTPSMSDLREQAKQLGVPAPVGVSKVDLAAAIAAAGVSEPELGAGGSSAPAAPEGDGVPDQAMAPPEPSVPDSVEPDTDPVKPDDTDESVEPTIEAEDIDIDFDDEDDDWPNDEPEPDEDDGTVWIDGFHVDVGSAAHEALVARGLTPHDPPEGA